MSNCIKVQNKPTDLSSRMIYDGCYKSVQKQQSAGPGLYQLNNFQSCKCEIPDVKEISLNRPSFSSKQFRDGYGWTSIEGCNVDKDSKLRNAKNLTNLRFINQLSERPYLTVPYMGRGSGDAKVETQLLPAEDTSQSRPCNALAGVTIGNYFTPLVKNLEDNVQNPKYLIQEDSDKRWVRGGIPTRQIVKNIDYLERCGKNL